MQISPGGGPWPTQFAIQKASQKNANPNGQTLLLLGLTLTNLMQSLATAIAPCTYSCFCQRRSSPCLTTCPYYATSPNFPYQHVMPFHVNTPTEWTKRRAAFVNPLLTNHFPAAVVLRIRRHRGHLQNSSSGRFEATNSFESQMLRMMVDVPPPSGDG